MKQSIQLAGRTIHLATNAYTPIAYKEQFGKDYFQDLFQMLQGKAILDKVSNLQEGEELTAKDVDISVLSDFDMTFFHRLFWTFAKSANPKIKGYEAYFMDLEEFPLEEVGPVLMNMLSQSMSTRKKSMARQKRARRVSR